MFTFGMGSSLPLNFYLFIYAATLLFDGLESLSGYILQGSAGWLYACNSGMEIQAIRSIGRCVDHKMVGDCRSTLTEGFQFLNFSHG
jgi:hypothetical protein